MDAAFQPTHVGFITHAGAALGYLVLALLVIYWRSTALSGLMLVLASLATMLWGAAVAYDLYHGPQVSVLSQILELARSCSWLMATLTALYWLPPVRRTTLGYLVIGFGICVAILIFALSYDNDPAFAALGRLAVIVCHIALALAGLALIENLFRNTPPNRYWKIKYLCFGAGALFAYDFFLYSDDLLFRRLNADLFFARGITNTLLVPLLALHAVRNRKTGPQITVSHRLAFHSATLIGAGVYLLLMAAAGYYVRQFGGTWSGILQASFLFGTIVLLIVPLSSGSFRAYLRVFVEKSFFKYKFDYREEWLRFIQTISAADGEENLRTRVIKAIGDIADSPEGGLWLQREPHGFSLGASWNLSRWNLVEGAADLGGDDPMAAFLERTQWIVNLDQFAAMPQQYEGLAIPDWLRAIARAWLVLPLIHHERLIGIMVLGRPRVSRELTWEDYDLLKTVGRHAASHLAEQQMTDALAEARQFEAFNKRFAFVVHDIKNLASQLSLILSNESKHRGNVNFQNDMIETVRQSVDKMNRLLRQLHGQPQQLSRKVVELAPLLRKIVEVQQQQSGPVVSLDAKPGAIAVAADEDRLKAVVEHLVQNAKEAVGDSGKVLVRLTRGGKMAVVEIEDDGPGMDADFIRDKLFQPFKTTKGTGYGIGVYETREFANSLGGRLDVASRPGQGTIMRMSLPMADAV